MSQNNERADRAARALEAYAEVRLRQLPPEDIFMIFQDLLSDLRHFADYNFIDFADRDQVAHMRYREEVDEFGVARPGPKEWKPGEQYP